jgi:hypothetical protein
MKSYEYLKEGKFAILGGGLLDGYWKDRKKNKVL